MKILLLNAPFLPNYSRCSRSPAVTKSGTIYYPIWLANATGYLEKHGHVCMLIDAPASGLSREDVIKAVKGFQPDMVVCDTTTPSIYSDIEVVNLIKADRPNIFVVLVGTHASALPEDTIAMSNSVDAIARHEYDDTLRELAGKLQAQESIFGIAGLTYRDDQGIVKSNPNRVFMANLDEIPFLSEVYKNHLNYKDYFYAHCRYPVISIFTSRGCTARCTFCMYPQTMFGQKHRARSPKNIADEFDYIAKTFPDVKDILVDDDTFSMNHDHAFEVCSELIRRGNKLTWTCEVRASLQYETLKIMREAGCRLVVVGYESYDQDVLNNIKKGITTKMMDRFSEDTRRAGIKVHACFMAGNPGDSRESLEKTLQFALRTNPDTAQFFPVLVYPGTEMYTQAKLEGRITAKSFRNWLTDDGMHNSVVNMIDTMTTKEILDWCDSARRRYYLRPSYITSKFVQLFTEPKEAVKTIKAFIIFAKHIFRNVSDRSDALTERNLDGFKDNSEIHSVGVKNKT